MVTVAPNAKATNLVLDASDDSSRQIIPTKILIQPPVMTNKPKKGYMGLLIAGPQVNWSVDFNETLPDAIKIAALKTYQNVEIGMSCNDCGLIFRPTVKRLDINKLSMQAIVELEVRIYDAYNSKITRIEAIGKSSTMDATRISSAVAGYFIPFFGTALGGNILARTSRQALNNAIANFHAQIIEQVDSGVLARHWLPSRKNRGYEIGDHQIPAERVSRAAGCGTPGDEVRLVKKNHLAESFIANCWGKLSFAIDCEYGRCTLREERQSLGLQKHSKNAKRIPSNTLPPNNES